MFSMGVEDQADARLEKVRVDMASGPMSGWRIPVRTHCCCPISTNALLQ